MRSFAMWRIAPLAAFLASVAVSLLSWPAARADARRHHPVRAHAAEIAKLVNDNSYKCMGLENGSLSAGTRIIQWTCLDGHLSQEWQIIYGYGNTTYWAIENRASGLCLSVKGNGTANGTQVIQWPCSAGDVAELFWLNANSNGTFTIRARSSNKCVEVKSKSLVNGALVDIWDCNGGRNQNWYETAPT